MQLDKRAIAYLFDTHATQINQQRNGTITSILARVSGIYKGVLIASDGSWFVTWNVDANPWVPCIFALIPDHFEGRWVSRINEIATRRIAFAKAADIIRLC